MAYSARNDGSYDTTGDPTDTSGITSVAQVIALQRHPEAFTDPSVVGAQTPADKNQAIAAYLKRVDPTYDPNNVYTTMPNGGITPNTGSWFSDHLPLITGLMGAGSGGAGLLAGGAFGGAGAAAGEGASSGVGPLAGGYGAAATTAAAPAGIAATGGGSILGGASGLLGLNASPGGILKTAGQVGGALMGAEADRQAARQAEANAQIAQDRNAITAAQVNLGAPDARLASSVKGDIASNAKDFSYGAPTMVGNIPVPTSTGGLRPSILSPTTHALGTLNSQQALSNETADGGKPAAVTPLPQATPTDSILNSAGMIASLMGAIPYQAPKPTQPIFYTGGMR